jgi:hypothetical protein
VVSCGTAVVVAGERSPALSVSWEGPSSRFSSGFVVFFSECSLDVDEDEWPPSDIVCLHCLIDDGDEQLARGLDLARVHGQVDFDPAAGEWFVPEDACQA